MTVVESPANDMLPLVPAHDAMVDGGFDLSIDGWTASINEAIAYAAQVGAAGTGNGQFDDARGLDVDSTGRVWVADTNNERLQRFTAVPAYSAQTGSVGTGDGQFASNNGPYDVAIDASDNVLATDRGNQRLQRFNGGSGAFIEKFVGALMGMLARILVGGFGSGFSPIQFNTPQQVAVNSGSHVFVADYGNGRIVELTNHGVYFNSVAGLSQITGVAVDASGNVYVTFQSVGLGSVAKYTSGLTGVWSTAALGAVPNHIATDGTHVYIALANNTINKRLCSTGANVTSWGSAGTGDGQFNNPQGIAFDGTHLYVVDRGNDRVQKFTTAGVFVTKWGTSGSGAGQLGDAVGCGIDAAGNVWVADYGNNRLSRYTNTGTFLEQTSPVTAPTSVAFATGDVMWVTNFSQHAITKFDRPLAQPEGVDIKASTGRIYVADTFNHCVEVFTSAGVVEFQFGSFGAANGQFNTPVAVEINQLTGDVYVVDQGNGRVQQFTSEGVFIRTWGSLGAANGQFQLPTAIAVNQVTGDVSVLDATRDDVQRFTGSGTYVSKLGSTGSGDGQFLSGSGLAFDATGGILYASDLTVERVQRFNGAPIGAQSWDGAVGGEANGSLNLDLTTAPAPLTGIVIRSIKDTWHQLNDRESVQVAAWVTTDDVELIPLLQIEFANEDEVVLSTATEPVWTPVVGKEYRRTFAARAPDRVTQYRIVLAAHATTTTVTGQVWFDDITINANELVVIDQAMGEMKVTVSVHGRWIG